MSLTYFKASNSPIPIDSPYPSNGRASPGSTAEVYRVDAHAALRRCPAGSQRLHAPLGSAQRLGQWLSRWPGHSGGSFDPEIWCLSQLESGFICFMGVCLVFFLMANQCKTSENISNNGVSKCFNGILWDYDHGAWNASGEPRSGSSLSCRWPSKSNKLKCGDSTVQKWRFSDCFLIFLVCV